MIDEFALWVEVDTGCIRRNVERLKALLSPGTKLLVVVKANGYGHGDVEVAKAAIAGGADWLGVARVEEGDRLRDGGISKPILLLSEPPRGAVHRVVELGLTPTLYTAEVAAQFSQYGLRSGQGFINAQVKVDTGMHRYGVPASDLKRYLNWIEDMGGIEVDGIWSHLAVAEDEQNPMTLKQLDLYRQTIATLDPPRKFVQHIANSGGAINFPQTHLDMVRVGIATYGIHPSTDLAGKIELEPALTLRSRVGMVKHLEAGESLSYGQRYTLTAPGLVATIPCGYADGLPRSLSDVADVLIRGRRYRISGTITMDHFMVDAHGDEIAVGDDVVIIGRQADDQISVQEIANHLGTIPYEVVCGVSARVPRVYVES